MPRVAVLGAGPAGTSAAIALRRAGCEVVVVDPAASSGEGGAAGFSSDGGDAGIDATLAFVRRGNGESVPAVAGSPCAASDSSRAASLGAAGESVPPSISGALARLGLSTAALDHDHLRSLGTASAWGSADLEYRDYLLDGLGPGWHLDRTRFDRMLRAAAVTAGAVLVHGRWSSASRTATGWSLTCHGTRLTADVVVDATGRRAAFATAQGARRCFADRLIGVAATVPELPARRHVVLEAAENGWWYASPQPGGWLTLALLSDADLVRREDWARPIGWLAALRDTRHLDVPRNEPSLIVRDARSHLLTPSAGRGWLAAGDAAMALDPLSSAGVTLAIESGLAAAELIVTGQVDSAQHRQQLRRRFDAYLRQRREVYRAEQRWDGPFWTRRREGVTEARHLVVH
ncbi:NAD(P)/FAD-dependent oxidoreductase [Amycolatopsis sp. cg13]|uniref:NAD(P)/FAD-dependent oxidoreductase n=1 Tax=Amycolatopsis sp. cg13 TaxID=3238807 RepID=UPI003524B3ED